MIELRAKPNADLNFSIGLIQAMQTMMYVSADSDPDGLSGRRRTQVPGGRFARGASPRGGSERAAGRLADTVAPEARKGDIRRMEPDHVTPREMAAEIKAIEERMDRRHAELSRDIGLMSQSMSAAVERVSAEVLRLNGDVSSTKQDLKQNFDNLRLQIDTKYDQVVRDNKHNRWTIIITVVASALAAVGAIWTTNGNIMSAIELGRNNAQELTGNGKSQAGP